MIFNFWETYILKYTHLIEEKQIYLPHTRDKHFTLVRILLLYYQIVEQDPAIDIFLMNRKRFLFSVVNVLQKV